MVSDSNLSHYTMCSAYLYRHASPDPLFVLVPSPPYIYVYDGICSIMYVQYRDGVFGTITEWDVPALHCFYYGNSDVFVPKSPS
jgi:hypothetical protein